jgi:hypothetical protein
MPAKASVRQTGGQTTATQSRASLGILYGRKFRKNAVEIANQTAIAGSNHSTSQLVVHEPADIAP